MTTPQQDWPYPGSRVWKFDFHTHTPASADTYWAQQGIDLAPENWLLQYMAAEIDCVAITDHNSGAWVDLLKAAYEEMKEQADPPNLRFGRTTDSRKQIAATTDHSHPQPQCDDHWGRGNGTCFRL